MFLKLLGRDEQWQHQLWDQCRQLLLTGWRAMITGLKCRRLYRNSNFRNMHSMSSRYGSTLELNERTPLLADLQEEIRALRAFGSADREVARHMVPMMRTLGLQISSLRPKKVPSAGVGSTLEQCPAMVIQSQLQTHLDVSRFRLLSLEARS